MTVQAFFWFSGLRRSGGGLGLSAFASGSLLLRLFLHGRGMELLKNGLETAQ